MKYTEWSEDEDDEEDDFNDDSDTDDDVTEPCPNCGRQIYDDAEQCTHCGHYITDEDAARSRKPWWVILGAVLCLGVAVWWLLAFV
jgi:hypothetical protein